MRVEISSECALVFLKLMLIKDHILEVRLPQADKKESNQRIDEEIQIEENI